MEGHCQQCDAPTRYCVCEHSPPPSGTICDACDAPREFCVCKLCETTYEDTVRAVLQDMVLLRETEAATAKRWTPTLQTTRDAIASGGSREFDALELTEDMIAEFMDMSYDIYHFIHQ